MPAMPPPNAGRSEAAERGMRHQLRLWFLALQFFTRLPTPGWVGFDAAWQRQAMRYFPAVGWVVAALAIGVYALAAQLWPQPIAVLAATAAGILLTGAIHEDGMADACDGFGAGGGAGRILGIMRDSHIGVFGVLGVGLTLALKCAALMALPGHTVWAALLLGHPWSRLACLPLVRALPYARTEGKAAALVSQKIGRRDCAIGLLTVLPAPLALGIGGWLPWSGMVFGMLLACGSTWLLARLFMRRIGGYTGDCLGAVQQVAEIMLYLGLAAALPF
jgi:adenosylcobinamide-GDP ribazoletransferase